MPFQKSYDLPLSPSDQVCIHLRNKSMYVTGSIEPEHPEEPGRRHCWCNLTQHVVGPDQGEVDRPKCIPGRDCYRSSY